jgi:peptidoglycan/xylan/chitin deacetylase (PgdA/CDA1 family)
MKRASLLCFLLVLVFPLFSQASNEVTGDLLNQVRYWDSPLDLQEERPLVVPQRRDPRLLVVLYHNVVFGRTGNIYNRDFYNLEHDLAFLRRNFSLTNFSDLLNQKIIKNADNAIITFDDGDLSLYAIVYPLFKQHAIEATIFLVPDFVGDVGYMSWDQVREMNDYRTKEGKKLFYFESHALTHPRLGRLSEAQICHELRESKRIIEEQTGSEVTVLALPYGDGAGDARIERIAKELGYKAIRTSTARVVPLTEVNPWKVDALNVENYSTDVFVEKVLALIGR